jgi:glyoxylase-like metal-dependent hydrolase (beta-lactamase superfamily II)
MPPDRRSFLKQVACATLAASLKASSQPASLAETRTFPVGRARLDVINIGDITAAMAASMRAPAGATDAEKAEMAAALADHRLMPMQDVLVRLAGTTVMVDAGAYDIAASETYHVPGYVPPPPLAARLAALGVVPDSVEHVVFTHRHFDHISGAVVKDGDGKVRPLFPNARHYIQKPDWEYALTRINDPATRIGRTFSVLHPAGLVEVIEGDRELAPGIRIMAAPGETPGHQAVRVESDGQVAYLVGDLIHHAAEVKLAGFMVNWAEEASNLSSHRRIFEPAVDERALIVVSHIPEAGRIVRAAGRRVWENVAG